MPNVLGTLASSLIIQRALELVYTKRPILNEISLDLMDQETGSVEANFNQPIVARIFGIPEVQDFGTGAKDRADTDVPVTLDKFKEVHHRFTPQEYSGTSRNLVDESAEPIAIAIGNHMVDAIAALWTPGNFPVATNRTIKAAGWDYNFITALRGKFNGRGVPENRRCLCANTDMYTSFLNDSLIVAELNNKQNADAIANGKVPRVSGFGIQEYPALPANGANLVGFACSKDACVYAARVPKNPEQVLPNAKFPGNIGVITNPATGLSVMVNEWIDAATLTANVRLVWMYGVAKGNANNGELICTA